MSMTALYVLAFLWNLPAWILYQVFYVQPLLLIGYINFEKYVARFTPAYVVDMQASNWYTTLWHNFGGFSGPFFIIVRYPKLPVEHYLIKHELRHCNQRMVFGFLYDIVYTVLLIIYGYERNPFEVDAEKHEQERS